MPIRGHGTGMGLVTSENLNIKKNNAMAVSVEVNKSSPREA
jgi:hypothetical protein